MKVVEQQLYRSSDGSQFKNPRIWLSLQHILLGNKGNDRGRAKRLCRGTKNLVAIDHLLCFRSFFDITAELPESQSRPEQTISDLDKDLAKRLKRRLNCAETTRAIKRC